MNCVSPAEHAVDGAMVTSHCRLFPRLPQVRWTRRVHEQIQPSVERAGCRVVFSNVEIQHVGYQDPAHLRRKLNRDLRLLRLEHAIDPNDPVTLFNLGTTQLQIGMNEDALTSLLSSLKHTAGRADWMRRLYSLAATALARLNRREEALSLLTQGLQLFPCDADLITQQANLLGQVGDLGGAERALLRLLKAPREDYLVAGSRNVLDRREARCLLGMVYRDQGRHEAAERVLQELLVEFPDFVQAWVGLGYVYLGLRHFGDLDHVCKQLLKCPDGSVYSLILQAEGLIARDDLLPARALLDEAISLAPRMIWPRLVVAGWLMRSGAPVEQCRQAQRDILRLDPGNALALENLALLEQRSAIAAGTSPLSWTITV
jgi:tetratricopeptide (TPR) repeat protein